MRDRLSPHGIGDGPEIFGASIKDHHPAEAMPLHAIIRKVLYMRLVICARKSQSMLRTRQGRMRALLGVGMLAFVAMVLLGIIHLPDADDERTMRSGFRTRSQHREQVNYHAPGGAPLPVKSSSSLPKSSTFGSSPVPAADDASPPPPQPVALDGKGSAEYAAELHRRATELNQEIARFKERESEVRKAQRLRKTAEQLDSELRALKKVRSNSFSLKDAAARRAGAQASAGQAPQAKGARGTGQPWHGQAEQPAARGRRSASGVGGVVRGATAVPFGHAGLAGGALANALARQPGGLAPLPPPLDVIMKRKLPGRAGAQGTAAGSGAAAAQLAAAAGFGSTATAHMPDSGAPIVPDECRRPHAEFRIAIVMPWVTEDKASSRFPPWLPFFVATAAHSAMLVDFLMLHEGPLLHDELPMALHARARNVQFFDVGAGGIARLVAKGMGSKLKLPEANTTVLANRLRFMFAKWPRLVAEYKPAFGTVFADFLTNYTHWGYSDLDVILGHLPRFVERSELMEHHIVTYSFGDAEAVYLRGQWTIHQNLPNVNSIWMGCEHLGKGLEAEIYQKVAWVRRNEAAGRITYHKRFLSAEGCYSYRAMHAKGIKIKVGGMHALAHVHGDARLRTRTRSRCAWCAWCVWCMYTPSV